MKRSTPLTWEQVRVGALVLGTLVLLAVGVLFIGEVGHVFGDRYRLVTTMQSGAGLVPGSGVHLAGQTVGQVESIRWIDPDERAESGETVFMSLSVNRDVQQQIRTDSRARIRTQGLLGDRVVDITPGSSDAAVLQPGDTLASEEPLDYQGILEQASGAVTGLTELASHLEEITARLLAGEGSLGRLVTDTTLYTELASLSGSLGGFLERANQGEGSLGRLLRDDRLYERMVSVTAGLDTLTRQVTSGTGSLGRMVGSDSLYRSLHDVVGRSDSLLRRVEEGRGTAGRMMADEALYEELLRTLGEVNALLADLRDDPARYIPPVTVF